MRLTLLLPEREAARLEAVRGLRILDTPPEPTFDDITRLTSYICGTPIAFIGFMDGDRLWFKSRIGWEVPEIPRDMSFCEHTILQSDALIVPDTLADEGRLAACPLATHGGVRFYAGVPLMSAEGFALGTLCAMDSIPRGLTPGQTDALRRLGRQVVSLTESRGLALKSSISSAPPRLGNGHSEEASRVLGYSFWRDLSEQKRATEAARQSEQRLQAIIGSAMDAIITMDGKHRIVLFNKAAEEIFHCSASEALGLSIERFIPERFRSNHREHVEQFGNTGQTTRSIYVPGCLTGLRADGSEFPIEATISKVESGGDKFYTVILRDVSARLKMESELRQAHKMEAVGQLAGGIAHEFNNFLSVILGYSELLADEAIVNDRLHRYVTDIRTATRHAAALTRQLLTFARRQVVEPKILDLNQCIWEAHNLLRRLVPANIDVVPVLAPAIGRVKADAGQIQQILINLLVNSRDAMPQGGKVVIETANMEVADANPSQLGDLTPGRYVQLSVTDTGSGMSAETRAHLFEPFFTTKEPGRGTGLGLSTVYGIVKQGGGHISVETNEGKGTTFRIYLPRAVEDVVETRTEAPAVANSHPLGQQGPAAILVVEDETALRRLICFSLERRDYIAFAAKDGMEGVDVFRQHASEIQLVVSDLMMPRLDGLGLKQHIAALRPEVRFLFMSGYSEQIAEGDRGLLQNSAFLQKPFLLEELVHKVKSLLAGDAAA